MKKSKLTVSILLLVTTAVWGIVIFKIYNTVSSKSDIRINDTAIELESEDKHIDTFSLKLNYKDPFLKYNYSFMTNLNNTNILPKLKEKKEIAVNTSPMILFPNFSYLGAVKNQKSNVSFAYIQLNNESRTMKLGDSYAGIELKKIFKDSIEVMYLKKLKIIKK